MGARGIQFCFAKLILKKMRHPLAHLLVKFFKNNLWGKVPHGTTITGLSNCYIFAPRMNCNLLITCGFRIPHDYF